ncbi:uncharacterized protein LOC113003689 [Solenopsis invicta]|uniref:uncharacterized protein LOC113003689 n=1 Tax=Solenopsis invicta TaxID=13686 RepID=UPI000E33EB7F|nr:uncharacterized protein LOC113003689 [Solenopsis invicta]
MIASSRLQSSASMFPGIRKRSLRPKALNHLRVRLLENHEKHRGTKQRFSTLGAIFPSMRIGIFISVIRSLLSWILKHVLLSYLDDYFPGFLYLSSTFKHSFGRFTSTLCANKIKSETEKNPVFFFSAQNRKRS